MIQLARLYGKDKINIGKESYDIAQLLAWRDHYLGKQVPYQGSSS
jgi:hypothetical protein